MKFHFTPLALLAVSALPSLTVARPASHAYNKGGDAKFAATAYNHSPFVTRGILDQLPQHQSASIQRRQAQQPTDQSVVEVDQDPKDFVVVSETPLKSALRGPAIEGPRAAKPVVGTKNNGGKAKGAKAKRQNQIGVVNNRADGPSARGNGPSPARQPQALPVTPPSPALPPRRRSLERRQSQVGLVNNAAEVSNNNASPSGGAAGAPRTPTLPVPPAPGGPAATPRRRSEAMRKDPDTQDLQTLTHAHFLTTLLTSSYITGLSKFSATSFQHASYPDWVYGRLQQMKETSKTHDKFLGTALELGKKGLNGNKARDKGIIVPIKGCDFSGFQFTDVKSFVDEIFVLETVVVSALDGLVGIMNNKAYTSVLASIMSVRGRHAAWISSSVKNGSPWSSAFETPVTMNQAYTLLSKYVKSCPSPYDPRPTLKTFPPLEIKFLGSGSAITRAINSSSTETAQAILSFDLPKAYEGKRLTAALVLGTGTVLVPLSSRPESDLGTAAKQDDRRVSMNLELPKGLAGVVYVFVVGEGGGVEKDKERAVPEDRLVAGPGVIRLEFDSRWIA